MEESEDSSRNRKWVGEATTPTSPLRGKGNPCSGHHKSSHNTKYYEQSNSNTRACLFNRNQGFPALLPLPPILPLDLNPSPLFFNRIKSLNISNKRPTCPTPPLLPLPAFPVSASASASDGVEQQQQESTSKESKESGRHNNDVAFNKALVVATRPDSGGVQGQVISLIANHFRVQFDPSQRIFHYDIEISPNPSKELARVIKQKLVEDESELLRGACPAFDGRRNLYSPVQFEGDRIEIYVSLPVPTSSSDHCVDRFQAEEEHKKKKNKVFRISIRLVSKLDANKLSSYLSKEEEEEEEEADGECEWRSIPQDYLHALDVILRENSMESCIPVGRSLYSPSMGGSKDIGGGAVGLRGFFQSLRPTQQGLALNLDFAVTAFHESVGIISYLQKRFDFLRDLPNRKDRALRDDERMEVERALKNIRIFVCHRQTVERYRVHSLTQQVTEDLCFTDRDGERLRVLNYFKDHYNYDIQFRNLPCLQISRSKPCYLPMELCVICQGQKFLGKLSDDQTAKIVNMGCQRPRKRREIIDGIINGPVGPTSGNQAAGFKVQVSREMTRLKGRVLHPPKLRLGEGGLVRDVHPRRLDCQWNLVGGNVVEGTRIERWGLISFGGTPDQKSNIPRFINQLCLRCEQLGMYLNKHTTVSPQFESIQLLNNVSLLESKLKRMRKEGFELQLIVCLMEKKHKGYAHLKRIAETRVGVVTQCCLYQNLAKLSSQFLANIALKINAKVGGSTVSLYNSLPTQIPRLFHDSEEAVMFMGADVTHPHPLDDFSPSVAAVVGTTNWPCSNKYVSRIRSQTHRQEIIQDLGEMVAEILDDFLQQVSKLPHRIVFFRDGVSETQFYKVLKEELQSIKTGCNSYLSGYNPLITFAVVQKRHHTRLFHDDHDPNPNFLDVDENVPPGTVVDSVITHPTEFDFYLCSHWGVKGTSRPAHYHVLWDENKFTSDEFQKLVYSLCFTFVRCTKPISIVPPAYYAHLAAYRGSLYLERSESYTTTTTTASPFTRAGPPKPVPLPKISQHVKNLMFYC